MRTLVFIVSCIILLTVLLVPACQDDLEYIPAQEPDIQGIKVSPDSFTTIESEIYQVLVESVRLRAEMVDTSSQQYFISGSSDLILDSAMYFADDSSYSIVIPLFSSQSKHLIASLDINDQLRFFGIDGMTAITDVVVRNFDPQNYPHLDSSYTFLGLVGNEPRECISEEIVSTVCTCGGRHTVWNISDCICLTSGSNCECPTYAVTYVEVPCTGGGGTNYPENQVPVGPNDFNQNPGETGGPNIDKKPLPDPPLPPDFPVNCNTLNSVFESTIEPNKEWAGMCDRIEISALTKNFEVSQVIYNDGSVGGLVQSSPGSTEVEININANVEGSPCLIMAHNHTAEPTMLPIYTAEDMASFYQMAKLFDESGQEYEGWMLSILFTPWSKYIISVDDLDQFLSSASGLEDVAILNKFARAMYKGRGISVDAARDIFMHLLSSMGINGITVYQCINCSPYENNNWQEIRVIHNLESNTSEVQIISCP